MTLTDEYLVSEVRHLNGVRRIYKVGPYGLSLVNSPKLHRYSFAWEAAVLHDDELTYDTPLTDNVEVFMTDEAANRFIERAFAYFKSRAN